MNFKIDSVKLRECGNDIIVETNGINEALEKIFSRIANMSSNTGEWVGIGADTFARLASIDKAQYINFKEDLYKMGQLLVDTASILERDIKDLEEY